MANAQPGWYDDGSGRERYWDGQSWGDFRDDPSAVADVVAADGEPTESLVDLVPPAFSEQSDGFVYHTELISITEQVMFKTGSGKHGRAKHIGDRFTQLSAQGWEFVSTSRVPVVGRVFKADEHRTLTVAIFRRPRHPNE